MVTHVCLQTQMLKALLISHYLFNPCCKDVRKTVSCFCLNNMLTSRRFTSILTSHAMVSHTDIDYCIFIGISYNINHP